MAYYYFAASLPELVLGEEPPVDFHRFLFWCESNLAPQDMAEARLILEGREAEGRSEFVRRYLAWETQLRNAVARIRAGRRGRAAEAFEREHEGFAVFVERAASEAMAKADPLERERALDEFRWKMLEEAAACEPFGAAAVFAFAFRLRLAWRWQAMQPEKGEKAALELLEKLVRNRTENER